MASVAVIQPKPTAGLTVHASEERPTASPVRARLGVTDDGAVALAVTVSADDEGTESNGEVSSELPVKVSLRVDSAGAVAVDTELWGEKGGSRDERGDGKLGGQEHERTHPVTVALRVDAAGAVAVMTEVEGWGDAQAEEGDRLVAETTEGNGLRVSEDGLVMVERESEAAEDGAAASGLMDTAEGVMLLEELQEARRELGLLQSEVIELRDQQMKAAWRLSQDSSELEKLKEEHTMEVEAANAKIMALETQLRQQEGLAEGVGTHELKQRMEEQSLALTALVLEKQKVDAKLQQAVDFSKELDDALGEANETIHRLKPHVNAEIASVRQIMQTAFEDAAHAASLYENEVTSLKELVVVARRESRTALEALQEYRAWVEVELTSVTDELLEIQERRREEARSGEVMASEVEELRGRLSVMQEQNNAQAQRLIEYEKEEASLVSKNKRRQEELEAVSRELGAARESEEELRGQLERQQAEVRGLKESLERATGAAETVSGDLGTKLEAAQAAAEQSRENERRATAKMMASLDAMRHMEVDKEKLVTNLKVIEGELKALTNALIREQETGAKLRADVAAAHKRRRNAEQMLSRAQETEKDAKADLKRQTKLLDEAYAEITQWKAESDDWRKEATQLLVQLKGLDRSKKDVGRKSVEGKVLGDRRNGQMASVEELSERVRTTEAEAINFKSEAAVMKEMVHTLKVELRQKEKIEHDLRRRLKRLQETNGEAVSGSQSHRMR